MKEFALIEFASIRAYSFINGMTQMYKGGKNKNDGVASPESIPIHLNTTDIDCFYRIFEWHQGQVVQSIVSLTSSLRGQLKCFTTL